MVAPSLTFWKRFRASQCTFDIHVVRDQNGTFTEPQLARVGTMVSSCCRDELVGTCALLCKVWYDLGSAAFSAQSEGWCFELDVELKHKLREVADEASLCGTVVESCVIAISGVSPLKCPSSAESATKRAQQLTSSVGQGRTLKQRFLDAFKFFEAGQYDRALLEALLCSVVCRAILQHRLGQPPDTRRIWKSLGRVWKCARFIQWILPMIVGQQLPRSLRRESLSRLAAVQSLFGATVARPPKTLVWKFLRTPGQILARTDGQLVAFSLESGLQVSSIDSSAYFVGALAAVQSMGCTSPLQFSSLMPAVASCGATNELSVTKQDKGFQLSFRAPASTLPLYWTQRGSDVSSISLSASYNGLDAVDDLLLSRVDGILIWRAGLVVVSADYHWAAVVTATEVICYNTHDGKVLGRTGHRFIDQTNLISAGEYLVIWTGWKVGIFLPYTHGLGDDQWVERYMRNPGAHWQCQAHTYERYAAVSFNQSMVAISVKRSSMACRHRIFTGAVLFCTDKEKSPQSVINRICGCFDHLALSSEYLVTASGDCDRADVSSVQRYVVEVWPCHGPISCLLRVGGLGVLSALSVWNPRCGEDFTTVLGELKCERQDDSASAGQAPSAGSDRAQSSAEDRILGEAPAQIAPQEAADLVAVQEADFVQHHLGIQMRDFPEMPYFPHTPHHHEHGQEQLSLLQFNRHPQEWMTALSDGPALRACRLALVNEGYNWKLLTGTFVFVYPWQYRAAMQSVNGMVLKGGDMIVTQSMEYLVEESIASIKKGAWAKARRALDTSTYAQSACASASTAGDADTTYEFTDIGDAFSFECRRTFLSFVPRLLDAATVVQSTTEAIEGCVNHRRIRDHDSL